MLPASLISRFSAPLLRDARESEHSRRRQNRPSGLLGASRTAQGPFSGHV